MVTGTVVEEDILGGAVSAVVVVVSVLSMVLMRFAGGEVGGEATLLFSVVVMARSRKKDCLFEKRKKGELVIELRAMAFKERRRIRFIREAEKRWGERRRVEGETRMDKVDRRVNWRFDSGQGLVRYGSWSRRRSPPDRHHSCFVNPWHIALTSLPMRKAKLQTTIDQLMASQFPEARVF